MTTLNLPVNSVSFGQTSVGFLRHLFEKNPNEPISLFPIGESDLSAQTVVSQEFFQWIQAGFHRAIRTHNKNNPIFKLWHLQGSMESFSKNQYLFTFYELDSPTVEEINIVKNQEKVFVSSKYTKQVFEDCGCNNIVNVPLFFDKSNFSQKKKEFFLDWRITFNVVGKFERRKHHVKIIKSWIKKFGKNTKYFLNCSIYNPFMRPEENQAVWSNLVEGVRYENVQFLNFMPKNDLYNDYLNSGDIVIGLSGGEGWGLPEFHSVALGKHAVILNAHSYRDWATNENSVLVNPSGKIEAYDNKFFVKGNIFNQGNIFDWNEDAFIAGCEEAIKRVEANRLNTAGLALQEKFNVGRFVDTIVNEIK
jgi:glycosyltransferase involved in cell wall biosynthesis